MYLSHNEMITLNPLSVIASWLSAVEIWAQFREYRPPPRELLQKSL